MSGANYEWCPACGTKVLYLGEMDMPDDVTVLHATCQERVVAEAVKAERERIYDELGRSHYVIFAEDGWTVEHPVDCRLGGDMTTGCAYWAALCGCRLISELDPVMLGRWRIEGIDSEGVPTLVRADLAGGTDA